MFTVSNITKTFPGVKALNAVDLIIHPGEIHAICGENGAGKSTLMNILTGNTQPDSGNIIIDNQPVVIQNPQQAFDLGIAIVHQHLSLVDSLSVAENIYANQQPANAFGFIKFDELHALAAALLETLGMSNIQPTTIVSQLSPAQKQMVEIAKALSRKPSVLILDEPTASITEKESKTLFTILRKLKAQNIAILYISHRLEEIFLLADKITVLKDGTSQGTFPVAVLTKDNLITKMVGRTLKTVNPTSSIQQEVLLEVKNLSGQKFTNISFTLRRGEILGFAGLIGAGRSEIARAIFGADPAEGGEVWMKNVRLAINHPADAIDYGIAYVAEDRKSQGLFPMMSVRDNVVAASLPQAVEGKFYSESAARKMAMTSKDDLRIATPDVSQQVINLSGGNQQKVVLAKWLWTHPEILMVDEPTHGIDVGAKYEIYEILKSLASTGKGIIMISSDMPELLGICDRIIVIKSGKIAGSLLRDEASEEKIMSLAAN